MILVVAGLLWSAAPVGAASEPTSYYVSVGDSLAQGFQPIGGPHTNSAAAGYSQGYADELFKLARDGGGRTASSGQAGLRRRNHGDHDRQQPVPV